MRRLTKPTGRYGADFAQLIQAKRGTRRAALFAMLPTVRTKYAEYYKARKELEHLQPTQWNSVDEEALEHCYSSPTTVSKDIKASVLAATYIDGFGPCCYCLLKEGETFDHFVPASRFPEYAILAPNLVWCCTTCNIKKGAGLITVPRSVLNPYFDSFPVSTPFLYCSISAVDGKLEAKFFIPLGVQGLTDATRDIAIRHCRHFKIFEKFALEALSHLGEFLRELLARFPDGLTKELLDREISYQSAKAYANEPANHWRSAIWFAVEHWPEFFDYVQTFLVDNAINPPPPPARPPRNLELLRQIFEVEQGRAALF